MQLLNDTHQLDLYQELYTQVRMDLKDREPMKNKEILERHNNIMRSDEVRNKISKTLSTYRKEKGFSDEHLKKIKESRERRKKERSAQGLKFYDDTTHCATRSIGCFCILEDGKEYHFKSYREAGVWWFNTFHPFGEKYNESAFQRRIKKSIQGEEIIFVPLHDRKNVIKITNIKWYKEE